MSKEFHIFTHNESNYQQSFVFEVDRDNEDHSVVFKDLFLVTNTEYGEIKTRFFFQQMIESVVSTEGGNIDNDGVKKVIELFDQLISPEKEQEILDNINYKDVKDIDPDILIKISESIQVDLDANSKD